ncbi:hypothetical protein RSM67_001824 [Enterobacter roggenkampii]|nr:hypothetical protein [Escherichia coli]ELI9004126.1 hypothetical protein [Enterobacter roggenkampii]MBU5622413.1 hypothetical protein [Enterobacteriaceae bacterium S5_ASV_15]
MTNKFIVSTVDCINEFASDVPQSVSLRIDTMLGQRIRKLAAYVKKNDLYSSEFFFYDADWSISGEEEIQEIMEQCEYKHSDSVRQEEMLREVMPSSRTDCPVIRVMKDSFQLSALPRHCGDDMTLNTPSIPLSELKTNNTAFITLPTYN